MIKGALPYVGLSQITWVFEADSVLCFTEKSKSLSYDAYSNQAVENSNIGNLITGINIIDNLLFWVDNKSEPKKINIDRCKAGTEFDQHTKLMVSDPSDPNKLIDISLIDPGTDSGLKEEHITVIRRAPRTAPKLVMSELQGGGEQVPGLIDHIFLTANGDNAAVGLEIDVVVSNLAGENFDYNLSEEILNVSFQYNVGDELILKCNGSDGLELQIVATVMDTKWTTSTAAFIPFPRYVHTLKIESLLGVATVEDNIWTTSLNSKAQPLFELNMGRFSYRYKFQDNEYSSFAPWSELAFLPGEFDYSPKKGHNLGMINTIRSLKITNFIVNDNQRPDDVVEIDILYKDTVSPNVKVVKSVKRGLSPEWNDQSKASSGVVDISSEMMSRTLESSQILRAWDNVPRVARAQEVTGNRILYGNYLQNYDINTDVLVKQVLSSSIHPSKATEDTRFMPAKSLKSVRKYQIGVVFGDKYGRETPVMGVGGQVSNGSITPSAVSVDKSKSDAVNKLQASLSFGKGDPSNWMEYYKYYVKETSNEYYNLVLHRWYNAEDGNVWLAFASADRNKLDIETYITLKNEHGSDIPVKDEARYKVLAIENEAPDFIKTIPTIINDEALDYNTSGGSDIGKSLTLVADNVTAFDNVKIKGTAYARTKVVVTGTEETIRFSKWVRVAKINDDRITLSEPIGESANILNITGLSEAVLDWFVEIKDEIVENSPEFDGRFFVKILKDGIIDANVAKEEEGGNHYEILKVVPIRQLYTLDTDGNPANSNATYKGDYTNLLEGDEIPAVSTSLEYGGANFTGEAWDYDNVDGIDSESLLNVFIQGYGDDNACGISDEMESFWQQLMHGTSANNSTNDTSGGWFIDQAHIAIDEYPNGLAGAGPSSADYDNAAMGGLQNHANFSVLNLGSVSYEGQVMTGPTLDFYNTIQEAGTFFKFASDPSNTLYKTIDASPISYKKNWSKTKTFFCRDCTNEDACHRATFSFSFKNAITLGPMDTDMWDPRSALSHDGRSQTNILILKPIFNNEGTIVNFNDGNAVWETEPKDNVDSDLYYEATSALPIKLNKSNVDSFCPIGSSIEVHRPEAVANPIWLGSTIFNAGGLTTLTNYRNIISTNTPSTSSPYWRKIFLNDVLRFTHKDGMKTEGAVIDHMAPLTVSQNTSEKQATTLYTGAGVANQSEVIATYKSSAKHTINCTVTLNIQEAATVVPDFGEEWLAINNPLSNFDGVVAKRLQNNNVDDTGGVTGFIMLNHDLSPNFTTGENLNNANYYTSSPAASVYARTWTEWTNLLELSSLELPTMDELAVLGEELYYPDTSPIFDFLFPLYNQGVGVYNKHWAALPVDSELTNTNSYSFFHTESSFTPYTSDLRARAIQRFDVPAIDPNATASNMLNLSVTDPNSIPSGFAMYNNEGEHHSAWQPIEAVNATTGVAYKLPIGIVVKEIDTASGGLLYEMIGDTLSLGIAAGVYNITFQEITGYYLLDDKVYKNNVTLPWFNCYSFGNGLESNRVGDDFNAPQIGNGVNVSTTLDSYSEERRGSSMIYSGIYNSTSGVNNLNEFNMAEKITKDLNPSYGSIQVLKTRDTNVLAFSEDKVFKVLANKDALYNADGSVNLIASDRVLGSANTFAGDFGISSNPESLAVDGGRIYFTDKQRKKVLRLSQDGLTPISDIGMSSYFRDKLNEPGVGNRQELVGSFDKVKGEYNLSIRSIPSGSTIINPQLDLINSTTISFSEKSKGWSSFKSFIPEVGLSINNEYITGINASLWAHHDSSTDANTFYGGALVPSTIDILFNESPGDVKSFLTMNYEGSQAKVDSFKSISLDGIDYNDGEYYNLTDKTGWSVESFNTDLQEGKVLNFKSKEGKWFNNISGVEVTKAKLNLSELSVQGIGVLASTTSPLVGSVDLIIRENND